MILQTFVYALISASVIALVGVGFQIIFRVGKFFHFAHGGVFAVAPYLLLLLGTGTILPDWLSMPLAISLSILLGLAIEILCYRPIRNVSNSANALLLCSLGVFIVLQSSLALGFGSETRVLRSTSVREGWLFAGARLTTAQIAIVASALVCVSGTWAFMHFTSIGKQMKAVASDSELARGIGINVPKIYLWASGIASALAAIAGIVTSYDVDMSPNMGMQPLMMGVVAAIIGGTSLGGTAGGALVLGLAQHFGVVWLPSRWQYPIVFIVLIIFLLLRPQGILGKPLRKVAV